MTVADGSRGSRGDRHVQGCVDGSSTARELLTRDYRALDVTGRAETGRFLQEDPIALKRRSFFFLLLCLECAIN